jgi:hypothetical protein
MLVGVSVLSQNPNDAHAIEPYLIMHVAYCTYFMGLLIRPNPEFLTWEKEYFTFAVNAMVGAGLHGYDVWYWFVGQNMMRRTPGPDGTSAFFIYFGKQDLFGFMRYVLRVWTPAILLYLLLKLAGFSYIYKMEKKMDRDVPHSRLKTLIAQWDREMETEYGRADKHVSPPPIHERRLSSISVHSAPLVSSSRISFQEQLLGGNSLAPPRDPWRKSTDEKSPSFGKYIALSNYIKLTFPQMSVGTIIHHHQKTLSSIAHFLTN